MRNQRGTHKPNNESKNYNLDVKREYKIKCSIKFNAIKV